jgi:predicted RNase H-like HicB family nuclease
VVIYPEEEGGCSASCPSLPGCHSQGKTLEETIMNIKEAINLYIEVLVDDGLPVPPENFGVLLTLV